MSSATIRRRFARLISRLARRGAAARTVRPIVRDVDWTMVALPAA